MQTHQMLESRLAEKYQSGADEDNPGLAQPLYSDDDSDSRASRKMRKEEIVANLEVLVSPRSGKNPSSSGGEVSVRHSDRGHLLAKN